MLRLALVSLSLCCLASGLALADDFSPSAGPTITGFTVTQGPGDSVTISGTVDGGVGGSVTITGAAGTHTAAVRPDGSFIITVQTDPGASGVIIGSIGGSTAEGILD